MIAERVCVCVCVCVCTLCSCVTFCLCDKSVVGLCVCAPWYLCKNVRDHC